MRVAPLPPYLPPRPSERNFDVYRAVSSGLTQRVVAERFELDQSRVCRIVKQVKKWMIAFAPIESRLSPSDEANYFAADAYLNTLRRYQEEAEAAFRLTCQPPPEKEGETKPRRCHLPKPDIRCLKYAGELAEKIPEATTAVNRARYAAGHDRYAHDPRWEKFCEDYVSALQKRVREKRQAHEARRAARSPGIKPAPQPQSPAATPAAQGSIKPLDLAAVRSAEWIVSHHGAEDSSTAKSPSIKTAPQAPIPEEKPVSPPSIKPVVDDAALRPTNTANDPSRAVSSPPRAAAAPGIKPAPTARPTEKPAAPKVIKGPPIPLPPMFEGRLGVQSRTATDVLRTKPPQREADR
jgi:hypothetical protein